ncbi:DUF7544 domain-containing protein [Streptomyces sp. NPDC001970]
MNDTPGWASPGSARSDGQGDGVPRPDEPADAAGPSSKWSEQQPPAGQWAPPTAPGGGPVPPVQAGWGGGQRSGWGGPPPAAKPGVIPLRPLGVGEILDGAVSTLRAHWRPVLAVTITVSVISQIADILVQRYVLPKAPSMDPDAGPEEALNQTVDAMQFSMLSMVPTLIIALIATLFVTAMLTIVVSRSVLGRPVTLSEAWSEARPRLLSLLGLTLAIVLMCTAAIAVGALPGILLGSGALGALGGLTGVVVAIWLWVRYALASPALMLERQGIAPSMRRSAKLVHGAWWRTFGILLLVLVLTIIVSMIIAMPFGLLAYMADGDGLSGLFSGTTPEFGWPFLIITGIGAVIASAITYPISAGVTVLLYVDQRIRREALDLELARAAGVAGTGSSAPGDDTSRS